MNMVAPLVFATGLVVAFWAILATILPARHRIAMLLRDGVQPSFETLPAVRVSSRRGVVRQRVTTATGLRAAA